MTDIFANLLNPEYVPMAAVLVPVTAAFVILVIGDLIKVYARGVLNFFAAAAEVLIVFSMIPAVTSGGDSIPGSFAVPGGLPVSFGADPAGIVFACASAVLWLIISVWLTGYMSAHKEEDLAVYNAVLALCTAAVQGMCFSADLKTLVVFFEIIIAASCITIFLKEKIKRIDMIFFMCSFAGAILALISSLRIDAASETAELISGGFITEELFSGGETLALFMMMSGACLAALGTISAPSPARALIYAVTAGNAGVFFILRTVIYVFGPETAKSCKGTEVLIWVVLAVIIASFAGAIMNSSVKRRISCSSTAIISLTVLGICTLAPFSLAGAIYHIAAQAIAAALLFMAAGSVFSVSGKDEIKDMSGLWNKMPAAMGAFWAGIVAAAGFPPFAGFPGTANIIYGAVFAGKPVIAASVPAAGILTIAALMPVFVRSCHRTAVDDSLPSENRAAYLIMIIPVVLTVMVLIFLGIAPNYGLHLFDLALTAGNSAFMPLM